MLSKLVLAIAPALRLFRPVDLPAGVVRSGCCFVDIDN